MVAGPPPSADRAGAEQVVAEAGLAAVSALQLVHGLGLEDPLVEPEASLAERIVWTLPRASGEPVERNREVVHPQPAHMSPSRSRPIQRADLG